MALNHHLLYFATQLTTIISDWDHMLNVQVSSRGGVHEPVFAASSLRGVPYR